jgi:hypothetical protein
MAEWSIAAVLKTVEPARAPRVRIPVSPLFLMCPAYCGAFLFCDSIVMLYPIWQALERIMVKMGNSQLSNSLNQDFYFSYLLLTLDYRLYKIFIGMPLNLIFAI